MAQLILGDLQHRNRRNFRWRLIEMNIDSRLQRCETELVTTQSAKKRFAFQGCHESLLPDDDSRLRSAKELVAAEADQIRSSFQCFRGCGFVLGNPELLGRHNRAAAQILHKRNPLFLRERCDGRRGRRLYKTAHDKIAAMNFQNHCAPGINRAFVIIECRVVGGSDLAEYGACGFDYFANSKTTSDLDQLTTRNDDFVFRRRARTTANSLWPCSAISCRKMVND